MDRLPIFSSYSQGENRVSSSILAVFARIDLRLVEELLMRMAGGDAINLVGIRAQYRKKDAIESVPDGAIIANAQVLFEFKLYPEELTLKQLLGHCKHFYYPDLFPCWLIAVTPDSSPPTVVDEVDSVMLTANPSRRPKVRWCSFSTLKIAIDEVLTAGSDEIADRDRFLLRELQALIGNEGLLAVDETVIVAARTAWTEYEKHQIYVCQANRSFGAATHMGFYTRGYIKRVIPKILGWHDIEVGAGGIASVVSGGESVAAEYIERLNSLCANGGRAPGFYRLAVLTGPQADETIRLNQDIKNDQVDKNGKNVAWTMGQRPIGTDRLTTAQPPTLTSHLRAVTY